MKKKLFLSAIIASFAIMETCMAQMIDVPKLPEFDKVFSVKTKEWKPKFDARCIKSNIPGNLLYKDDKPEFTFQIVNNTATEIDLTGRIEVIPYASRGRNADKDIWRPVLFRYGNINTYDVKIKLSPEGFQNIVFKPEIPEKFGSYGIVLDLGKYGRRFVMSCARVMKNDSPTTIYPKSSLDGPPRLSIASLKRLGIRTVRYEFSYVPMTAPRYNKWFKETIRKLSELKKAGITVMMMVGAPDEVDIQPLNMPRPHLTENGIMLNTKSDMAWMPEYDKDFEEFCYRLLKEQGYPKGPITAFSLWNEPWEGISISGWGADMIRYKTIYCHLASAVRKASEQDNVKVIVGGTDSTANALDKLFSDPDENYLPIFDFSSIHYQGLFSGSIINSWADRKSQYGPVRLWDTESWVANSDERIAGAIAGMRASGLERTMGVFTGYISTSESPGDLYYSEHLTNGKKRKIAAPPNAWSMAAPVAACSTFIGDREFGGLLNPDGLPWVFVFKGLKDNEEDGTVVLNGDIRQIFGHDQAPFRNAVSSSYAEKIAKEKDFKSKVDKLNKSFFLNGEASIIIAESSEYQVFDCYGNVILPVRGKYTIPLDASSWYLRGRGKKGSFKKLLSALKGSVISGLSPLEIIAHDLLAPIAAKPSLKINLKNLLNRDVTGTVKVKLASLELESTEANVNLKPGAVKELNFKIKGGTSLPDNTYKLSVKFTGKSGESAVLFENIHVNMIAARTINIDGKMTEWAGIPGHPVTASGTTAPSMTEQAWLPFASYTNELKNGFAQSYLAYDDKYFYFAAKIADDSISPPMPSFADMDEDQFFYPETSYKLDPERACASHLVSKGKTNDPDGLLSPDGKSRNLAWWESYMGSNAMAMDIEKAEFPCDITLYLPKSEDSGGGICVEARDIKTNKIIDMRVFAPYRNGIYYRCTVSSPVRLRVRSRGWWYTAKLGGIFFDPASEKQKKFKYLGSDGENRGDWKGKYGSKGFMLAGYKSELPEKVKVIQAEDLAKTPCKWPKNVRRFSYRKNPVLPYGGGFDNVQIGFNVLPDDKKEWSRKLPGVPEGYAGSHDTDYEFALNPLADGKTEIFRLLAPGVQFKHFYPRQWKSKDIIIKNGKLVINHKDGMRIVEAAIPWSAIPEVKKCMKKGENIKFTFRINDNTGRSTMELPAFRSISKINNCSLHPLWAPHWANTIEFGWEATK